MGLNTRDLSNGDFVTSSYIGRTSENRDTSDGDFVTSSYIGDTNSNDLQPPVVFKTIPVELTPGWNTIAYTLPYAQDPKRALYNFLTKGEDLDANRSDSYMNDFISQYIRIIKRADGAFYWPGFNHSNMGDLQPGQGYNVNVKDVDLSELTEVQDGKYIFHWIPVNSFNQPVFSTKLEYLDAISQNSPNIDFILQGGWQIIGFSRYGPQNAEDALFKLFAPNVDDITDITTYPFESKRDLLSKFIVILKDNLGNFYWPSFDYNGIGNLIPGQGYKINVKTTFEIPIEVLSPYGANIGATNFSLNTSSIASTTSDIYPNIDQFSTNFYSNPYSLSNIISGESSNFIKEINPLNISFDISGSNFNNFSQNYINVDLNGNKALNTANNGQFIFKNDYNIKAHGNLNVNTFSALSNLTYVDPLTLTDIDNTYNNTSYNFGMFDKNFSRLQTPTILPFESETYTEINNIPHYSVRKGDYLLQPIYNYRQPIIFTFKYNETSANEKTLKNILYKISDENNFAPFRVVVKKTNHLTSAEKHEGDTVYNSNTIYHDMPFHSLGPISNANIIDNIDYTSSNSTQFPFRIPYNSDITNSENLFIDNSSNFRIDVSNNHKQLPLFNINNIGFNIDYTPQSPENIFTTEGNFYNLFNIPDFGGSLDENDVFPSEPFIIKFPIVPSFPGGPGSYSADEYAGILKIDVRSQIGAKYKVDTIDMFVSTQFYTTRIEVYGSNTETFSEATSTLIFDGVNSGFSLVKTGVYKLRFEFPDTSEVFRYYFIKFPVDGFQSTNGSNYQANIFGFQFFGTRDPDQDLILNFNLPDLGSDRPNLTSNLRYSTGTSLKTFQKLTAIQIKFHSGKAAKKIGVRVYGEQKSNGNVISEYTNFTSPQISLNNENMFLEQKVGDDIIQRGFSTNFFDEGGILEGENVSFAYLFDAFKRGTTTHLSYTDNSTIYLTNGGIDSGPKPYYFEYQFNETRRVNEIYLEGEGNSQFFKQFEIQYTNDYNFNYGVTTLYKHTLQEVVIDSAGNTNQFYDASPDYPVTSSIKISGNKIHLKSGLQNEFDGFNCKSLRIKFTEFESIQVALKKFRIITDTVNSKTYQLHNGIASTTNNNTGSLQIKLNDFDSNTCNIKYIKLLYSDNPTNGNIDIPDHDPSKYYSIKFSHFKGKISQNKILTDQSYKTFNLENLLFFSQESNILKNLNITDKDKTTTLSNIKLGPQTYPTWEENTIGSLTNPSSSFIDKVRTYTTRSGNSVNSKEGLDLSPYYTASNLDTLNSTVFNFNEGLEISTRLEVEGHSNFENSLNHHNPILQGLYYNHLGSYYPNLGDLNLYYVKFNFKDLNFDTISNDLTYQNTQSMLLTSWYDLSDDQKNTAILGYQNHSDFLDEKPIIDINDNSDNYIYNITSSWPNDLTAKYEYSDFKDNINSPLSPDFLKTSVKVHYSNSIAFSSSFFTSSITDIHDIHFYEDGTQANTIESDEDLMGYFLEPKFFSKEIPDLDFLGTVSSSISTNEETGEEITTQIKNIGARRYYTIPDNIYEGFTPSAVGDLPFGSLNNVNSGYTSRSEKIFSTLNTKYFAPRNNGLPYIIEYKFSKRIPLSKIIIKYHPSRYHKKVSIFIENSPSRDSFKLVGQEESSSPTKTIHLNSRYKTKRVFIKVEDRNNSSAPPRIQNIEIYKASNGYSFKNNSTFEKSLSNFNSLPSYDLYFKGSEFTSQYIEDVKIDFYSSSKFIPIQVSASFNKIPLIGDNDNQFTSQSINNIGITPNPINTQLPFDTNEDQTLVPLSNKITLNLQNFNSIYPLDAAKIKIIKLSFFPSFDSYNKSVLEGSSEFGEIGIHNISFGVRTSNNGTFAGTWVDDEIENLTPLIDQVPNNPYVAQSRDLSLDSLEDSSSDSSSDSSGDSTDSSEEGGGY